MSGPIKLIAALQPPTRKAVQKAQLDNIRDKYINNILH